MLNIKPIQVNASALSSSELQKLSQLQEKKVPCFLLNSCTSTFDVLKAFLFSGVQLSSASSVLAKQQQAGRGQFGNSWFSPKGGLYVSALLQKDVFSGEMQPLASLVLGAATIEVLRNFGEEVFLKWPNDVLKRSVQGWCKAGGMLLQSQRDWLFWGLGLNLENFATKNFEAALPPIRLCLGLSPLELWLKLWPAVWQLLERWYAISSKEIFIKEYIEPLLAFKNEKVILTKDGECYCGVFQGLNSQGAALLDCQEQLLSFYNGSLRPYRSNLQLQE